jgi:beta-1,4-mannosyltransferase
LPGCACTAAGATVSLVGYTGETCVAALEEHTSIRKCLISPPAVRKLKLPRSLFLLAAPFKVLQQLLQLFWVLCVVVEAPDAILVQNPPAIPALLVVWVVRALRGCSVVVDWHNLGYTVLAENSLGASHPIIPVARWYERVIGSRLDAHLCVTKSFKGWLDQEWGINAAVLYDKPPAFFKQTAVEVRHDLFGRIGEAFSDVEQAVLGRPVGKGETMFTRETKGGKIELREDRPALLISSTSWTPDEDFGLLLDALVTLDASWSAGEGGPQPPHLLVVVTGKGPERAMYEDRISRMALQYVHIKTMWLEMVRAGRARTAILSSFVRSFFCCFSNPHVQRLPCLNTHRQTTRCCSELPILASASTRRPQTWTCQ